MTRLPRRLSLFHLLPLTVAIAGASGCSRGCSGPPPPPVAGNSATPADAAAQKPVVSGHPAAALEQALQLQLPERQIGDLLPGWKRLPFRKLAELKENQQLVIAVSAQGVRLLEKTLSPEQAETEQRLSELLRWATDQWQRRSGLAANRLVLAADRNAPPMLVAQVREVALALQPWRVVILARDGDHLVELSLNPPPQRRPSGQPMPIAEAASTTAR